MSSSKEIRTKIGSVRNTQKITKAMEMVAASKMRKTQSRMRMAQPYADKIRSVISHLGLAHSELSHPMLKDSGQAVKRIGLIVVSSDRGLCGGLNANMFRSLVKRIKQWDQDNVEVELSIIGSKGLSFFTMIGANVVSNAVRIGDSPTSDNLIGPSKIMIDAFASGHLDKLYIVYNKFVNSMTQSPMCEQLLPLPQSQELEFKFHWDYLYEPDPTTVLELLIRRYTESLVYQAVVENIACEQAARMVAMKSAADNANKLIDELQLVYNKARQAQITQELSEIIGGAAAIG
ncbi:MAG: F0F1 ATP synthase subunit gamma [Candidatus Porifericomitaceae bacterium WSBS_2022_MAG_OTU9]